METLTFRIPWITGKAGRAEPFPTSEWLLTNGLGGYASATLTGLLTRRYHGLLIAALSQPAVRRVMLSDLEETIHLPDGRITHFGLGEHFAGASHESHDRESGLTEFRLEWGLPIWRFEFDDATLEKALVMPADQNTLVVRYQAHGEAGVRLELRPFVHFRDHSAPVDESSAPFPYAWRREGGRLEVRDPETDRSLRLCTRAARADFESEEAERRIYYPLEQTRGHPADDRLWSPGRFSIDLAPEETADLLASAESWSELDRRQSSEDAFAAERRRRRALLERADRRIRTPEATQLALAADQFLITPVMRREDAVPALPPGEKGESIIAGYHWFTDWGRDAMISLEGLTLLTGRESEARSVLRTFASAIRDGLLPDLFPEGRHEAVYSTADASLWFFHAVDRYVESTGDGDLLEELLSNLRDIVERYQRGTRYGIQVDPADGLVQQGDAEFPLTWMDAHVDDWIVTPRRGKAVEINALWYNALRLLEGWLCAAGETSAAANSARAAEHAWRSFNDRYWYAPGGFLYDVVDGEQGDDASCRPNQIFAISLRYPVLDPRRWAAVFETVRRRLLTPVGLRSLAPGSPGYQPVYFGDRCARDAAYHQGTVWPWLLGPYVDAWMRVHPEDRRVAHQFLQGILRTLGSACVGSLSEVHDAEEPYTPRGCIAQAWSMAEVLRAYAATAD